MNIYDVDIIAKDFNNNKESSYNKLFSFYKKKKIKCYKFINKKIKVDKNDFFSDFDLLLFHSLIKYNKDYIDIYDLSTSKFDRYFNAALKNLITDYMRIHIKSKSNKVVLTCTPINNDQFIENFDDLYIDDIITSYFKDNIDREIIKLKITGISRKDICKKLKLKIHEYRYRLDAIKNKYNIDYLLSVN